MPNLTSLLQPFAFETLVDATSRHQWVEKYWHRSIYFGVIYVFTTFSTKHYMKNRPAFDLQNALLLWNIAHAIFCTFGAIRMIPCMYYIIREFGFVFSICDNHYVQTIQPTVFWTWMFLWSKVAELGDVLFVVLRKRNLIFFLWYHHGVTMVLTWYLASQLVAVGHLFTVMNYTVHSVIYLYYTINCLGVKPVQKIGVLITIIELLQLNIGVIASFSAISEKYYYGHDCSFSDNAMLVSFCTYLSYLFLILRSIYNNYIYKELNKAKIIKKKG